MPKAIIIKPSKLQRLLFARLGDHYTRNHPRVFQRLGIAEAGANALRLDLKPVLSIAITRSVLEDLMDCGLVTSRRGPSDRANSILIYSLTDEGVALNLKAKEVK